MLQLFHPAFVHFSVALLVIGSVAEGFGLLFRRPATIRFGAPLTILGTLSLLPTLVTGYLAANVVALDEIAFSPLSLHELNGWLVLGTYTALLFWKGWNRGEVPETQRVLFALLLLVGLALVVVSAVLGGELVYVHGVGVAPRS